jgi:hypothetical protein
MVGKQDAGKCKASVVVEQQFLIAMLVRPACANTSLSSAAGSALYTICDRECEPIASTLP